MGRTRRNWPWWALGLLVGAGALLWALRRDSGDLPVPGRSPSAEGTGERITDADRDRLRTILEERTGRPPAVTPSS